MNMIDKILTLANAGYNRDEISQMLGASDPQSEPAPAPDPEPQPEPAPAQPAPQPAPAQPAQPAPQPAPAQPAPQPASPAGMDALNARLDKLIQRMEQDSINRSNQPPKETTDDILASIIRPKRKE